mmetsp:Transcript_12454/g.32567  ORF Transcript_12454/g.32567 Transcript_12454/m.32567 type:complete len:215 (+) Transcript_12454:142-786(+)
MLMLRKPTWPRSSCESALYTASFKEKRRSTGAPSRAPAAASRLLARASDGVSTRDAIRGENTRCTCSTSSPTDRGTAGFEPPDTFVSGNGSCAMSAAASPCVWLIDASTPGGKMGAPRPLRPIAPHSGRPLSRIASWRAARPPQKARLRQSPMLAAISASPGCGAVSGIVSRSPASSRCTPTHKPCGSSDIKRRAKRGKTVVSGVAIADHLDAT